MGSSTLHPSKRFDTLEDWLSWQETLNPAEIDLGLDRLHTVMERGDLRDRFSCPLIIVAGTNGKGSVVSLLEAIAISSGHRVGSYTSPHLNRYNERIRFDGLAVDDDRLCSAFERIDAMRGSVPLTYFEFGTLAAIELFHRECDERGLDLVVMEIGLGARLDAVNIMQPDVSVITTIALDHTDWLGETRDEIGAEKAGVMRESIVTVIGDHEPPNSLFEVAETQQAVTVCIDSDFSVLDCDDHWMLAAEGAEPLSLPRPVLSGRYQLDNAACAIMALRMIDDRLVCPAESIGRGLISAVLPGRLQTIRQNPEVIIDVSHNVQAIQGLIQFLNEADHDGRTHLVFALLADKAVDEIIGLLAGLDGDWYIAGLDRLPRGLDAFSLRERVEAEVADVKLSSYESVEQACAGAVDSAEAGDRIVVTGSFITAADALRYFERAGN